MTDTDTRSPTRIAVYLDDLDDDRGYCARVTYSDEQVVDYAIDGTDAPQALARACALVADLIRLTPADFRPEAGGAWVWRETVPTSRQVR